MKHILILFIILLMSGFAFSEVITDMDKETFFQGEAYTLETETGSTDTDTSRVYSISEFDGHCTQADTNMLEIPVGYSFVSASGSVNITLTLQGSYNDLDWMDAVDIVTGITSEALTNTIVDIGHDRFPYYRIIVKGLSGNNADTVCKFWMYLCWKRD